MKHVHSMKPVTTGQGVSGTFADKLATLIEKLRTDTGDPGWHLHMQVLRGPEYSVRVYAPDRHSELHTITMTSNAATDIREILVKEAEQYGLRARASAVAAESGSLPA